MALLDPIPSPVSNADFAALEWEPLLALVAGFAASAVGRAAIVALRPSTDAEWITHQHQLTGEMRLLLEEQISIALGGLFDPTQLADKARIPENALEADGIAGGGAAGARYCRVAGAAAGAAGAGGGPAAGIVGVVVDAVGRPAAAGGDHRAQDHAGRLAGRRRFAGTGPHSPRAGAAAASD